MNCFTELFLQPTQISQKHTCTHISAPHPRLQLMRTIINYVACLSDKIMPENSSCQNILSSPKTLVPECSFHLELHHESRDFAFFFWFLSFLTPSYHVFTLMLA